MQYACNTYMIGRTTCVETDDGVPIIESVAARQSALSETEPDGRLARTRAAGLVAGWIRRTMYMQRM